MSRSSSLSFPSRLSPPLALSLSTSARHLSPLIPPFTLFATLQASFLFAIGVFASLFRHATLLWNRTAPTASTWSYEPPQIELVLLSLLLEFFYQWRRYFSRIQIRLFFTHKTISTCNLRFFHSDHLILLISD